jgi:CheY-like chemotaxis protein
MPQGGLLAISAENLTLDKNYTRTHLEAKEGKYIAITVADTGAGMPPELVERIFEPFFTTKEVGKGTGLGLSTALGIVKSHHGFITVTNTPGKGTQFKIFLPAVLSPDAIEHSSTEALAGHQELILVVDDEASIREVTQASLETYNYSVITACDGLEAVEVYARRQADIRLVIMDLMMPSLDGATAFRILQKINPAVKVIAVRGLPPDQWEFTTPDLGIQHFLPKPHTVEELITAVHETLQ